jgi:hypothetical protein
LEFKADVEATRRILREAAQGKSDDVSVACFLPARRRRRYDWLFVDELLDISNALGYMDVDGAKAVLLPVCALAT